MKFRANTALKKAQSMLRETERELALLKRNKATKISQAKVVRNNTRGGTARGRGGARGGGGRGGRGAGRGGRGGRGGGAGAGRGKPKSQDALDAELDGYMLGTKAGLDKQMEDYMSSTKVRGSLVDPSRFSIRFLIFYFRMGLTNKWKTIWPKKKLLPELNM